MPVFASTPEQDMILIVDEGEQDFSGLQQVSDEQLAGVEGDRFSSAADGASNITITGGSATKNVTINVGASTGASGGNGSFGLSTNVTNGTVWTYDPKTGITTYTHIWTSNGTVYSTTWQVDSNAGIYPTSTTSTNTKPSSSDAGASWK